jgi:exodeoxyribonuclease V gamma subunit
VGLAGLDVRVVGHRPGVPPRQGELPVGLPPTDPDHPTLFDDAGDATDASDEPDGSTSLLGRLRSDLRADRAPDGTHVLDPADRSVQVHACTGVTRQVEVLRDAVLHLLADDPELTEGDIAVLCPRMDVFSPVVQAVLGPSVEATTGAGDGLGDGGAGSGAPRLRYRVTDRTVRSDVPLLGALATLLDLVPSRFTASAVADFLGLGPVRDRFGLGVEELGRLDDWIEHTRIRWGLDGGHRAAWGLPDDFSANSWSAGLDQLLVGTVVRADRHTLAVGGVAPLPVGDGSMVLAARVADAVRTLGRVREDLLAPRTVADWSVAVRDAIDHLCSLPPAEAWQRRRLDRVLDELVAASAGADGAPSPVMLPLGDLRRLLSDRLVGDPARAAFGTGAVTFCSLSPLRSVPHKVVCILGLDQDAMPRGLASGDDLLALAPALGDRDARSEARQLLLEAVLAARDTLVITAGSADVRTNAPVPPAVVLDELWDHLGDLCTAAPEQVRDQLEIRHPRQAFAETNFGTGGAHGPDGRPWSFDPLARDGAAALAGRPPETVRGPLLDQPVPAVAGPDPVVGLDDLRRFLRRPVETFFVERLGLRLPRVDEDGVDDLPVRLDPLESYQVGDQLLACLIEGVATDRVLDVLRARGALPPGRLGDDEADRLGKEVGEFVAAAAELGVPLRADQLCDVDVEVGGRRLRGVVPCGSGPVPGPLMVRFSRRKDHHGVLLAVDLLALTAADPDVDRRAVSIYRGDSSGDGPATATLAVRGDGPSGRRATALSALDGLLGLRARGLTVPLPLFDATSRALYDAGPDPSAAALGPARLAWADSNRRPECQDPYHRLAFGTPNLVELLAMTVDGTGAAELARDLWGLVESAVGPPPEEDR